MRSILIYLGVLGLVTGAFAEFRSWTDQKGNSFEGELVSEMGEQVCLRSHEGKIIKVPKSGLCEADNQYVRENRKPKLRLDLGKVKKRLNTYSYYYDGKTYYAYELRAKVKVENASMYEPGLPLNMHVFFFSESDELIRHEHDEDIQFDGRGKRYEFETSAMKLYEGSGTADTSKVYGGYLLMVTDSKHRIVATRSTNDKAETKLDKLLAYGISKIKKDSKLPFAELQPYKPNSRL